jgi:hypothetical protein
LEVVLAGFEEEVAICSYGLMKRPLQEKAVPRVKILALRRRATAVPS